MPNRSSISVRYKYADGWHVFQSDDVPGLYVASPDAAAAFDDLAPSIKLLLKLNDGIDCEVTPEQPFREFLASLQHKAANDEAVLVMSNKRFVVTGAVA
jgi:hypothetical protein